MTIGFFLRTMREQNDLTIKEVSDRSDGILDKTTISRIERDERGVSLKAAYAFSRIYNISMIDICETATGKRPRGVSIPFETSAEERKMIERFRYLSHIRKKVVKDIIRGLTLVSQDSSSPGIRKKLKYTLDKNSKEEI